MEKMRIVVGGFIGLLPAGGVAWDYGQYVAGFALLGHDVYYIEDTMLYPVYERGSDRWDDCAVSVSRLQQAMSYFNLQDRWSYRDVVSEKCYGLPAEKVQEICRTADVFVNVSWSTFLREEYRRIPVRILIDTDPMFTQIQGASQQNAADNEARFRNATKAYTHLFTFGENIGAPDCLVPEYGLKWNTTRQPICLDRWEGSATNRSSISFTTLMNWAVTQPLEYNGDTWGQKNVEFEKIVSLPQHVPEAAFSAIINQSSNTGEAFPKAAIEKQGWRVLTDAGLADSCINYRNYIARSGAEVSVAKETYVKAKTGWFSCRSACYLAAGLPVVTQDTGWSKFIPSGNGLIAFQDLKSAKEAVYDVMSNYNKHAKAAREIAEEFFDSNKLLSELLNIVT